MSYSASRRDNASPAQVDVRVPDLYIGTFWTLIELPKRLRNHIVEEGRGPS